MPYKENPSTKSPENWDSKVWRYISTSQLLSILEKDKLRFTRTDNFPDPYEGTLPDEVLEEIDVHSFQGDLPEQVQKDEEGNIIFPTDINSVKTYRKLFFHSCWNFKDFESKPMWDNKSKDGEGVAIMTTAKKLRKSFERFDKGDIYIGLVEYGSYEQDFGPEATEMVDIYDWKNVHLHKPIEFEEENELRATVSVLPTPEASPFNDFSHYSRGEFIDLDWSDQPDGLDVHIDKETLIEEVRLSPYADDWQKEVIGEVLKTYGLDVRVSRSNIFG